MGVALGTGVGCAVAFSSATSSMVGVGVGSGCVALERPQPQRLSSVAANRTEVRQKVLAARLVVRSSMLLPLCYSVRMGQTCPIIHLSLSSAELAWQRVGGWLAVARPAGYNAGYMAELRVAFVCPFGLQPKGSVSARALPLARSLVALGLSVTVVVPPWDDPARSGQSWETEGVLVQNVSLSGGPVAVAGRLVAAAWRWRAQIVHAFKPKGYNAFAFQWQWLWRSVAGGQLRLAVDLDDWEGPGGWNDLLPYRRWQKRLFAWQERWAVLHADLITVASHTLESIVWSLGTEPARVLFLPNGANRLDESSDIARMPLSERPVVLLYTRFAELPPSWAIEFARNLRKRLPGAQVIVLGEGLRGEHRALMEELATSGLQDALLYAGWTGQEDLDRWCRLARLAIIPFVDSLVSRAKCSVRLLELMARGMPVMASAVGENVYALGYGQAGFLMEGLDPDRWAEEAVAALSSPKRLAHVREAALRRAQERFSWQLLGHTLARRYEEVLGA